MQYTCSFIQLMVLINGSDAAHYILHGLVYIMRIVYEGPLCNNVEIVMVDRG